MSIEGDTENWTRLYSGMWARIYDDVISKELAECGHLLSFLAPPRTCCEFHKGGPVVNPAVLLTTSEAEAVCVDVASGGNNGLSPKAAATLRVLTTLPIDLLLLRWANYVLKTHTDGDNTATGSGSLVSSPCDRDDSECVRTLAHHPCAPMQPAMLNFGTDLADGSLYGRLIHAMSVSSVATASRACPTGACTPFPSYSAHLFNKDSSSAGTIRTLHLCVCSSLSFSYFRDRVSLSCSCGGCGTAAPHRSACRLCVRRIAVIVCQ